MIEKEEALKGNARIAKYMGIQPTNMPGIYDTTSDEFLRNFIVGAVPFDEVGFHRSWDWLMPVIHKIHEEMKGGVIVKGKDMILAMINITNKRVMMQCVFWIGKTRMTNRVQSSYRFDEYPQIEAAWRAVLDVLEFRDRFLSLVKNSAETNYIDLRVKYKLATGEYPVYGRDDQNAGMFRGDAVTGKYGMWLEESFYDGNREEFLRKEYMMQTGGDYPVDSNPRKFLYRYERSYVLWLEQYLVETGMIPEL